MSPTRIGFALAFTLAVNLFGAPLKPTPLWPAGGVPGSTNQGKTEHDTTTAKDGMVAGRRVMRLADISVPEILFTRLRKVVPQARPCLFSLAAVIAFWPGIWKAARFVNG